jgi:hypothetical protein
LYGCACCRRIVQLFSDDRSRTALESAERFADGLASREDLAEAHQGAVATIWTCNGAARDIAQAAAWVSAPHSWDAADATGRVSAKVLAVAADDPELLEIERSEQARLLREIIGNPFVATLPRPQFPEELVAVAKAMYAGADRRSALYAGLMQGGYKDLVGHFQTAGHPKGCWALDLILGKR